MKQFKYIWHACLWSSLVALPYVIGMMTSVLLAGAVVAALPGTCAAAEVQDHTRTATVARLTFTEREQRIWDALIETRRQLKLSRADLVQERADHALTREALAAAEETPAVPPSVVGPDSPPAFQWSTFAAGTGVGMALAAGLVLGILLSVN